MGDSRSVTQLLAIRRDDDRRIAAREVLKTPIDDLIPAEQKEALEQTLKKLGCKADDSTYQDIALAAKFAALEKNRYIPNADESRSFAAAIESASSNLLRLLKSEEQNDWIWLDHYLSGRISADWEERHPDSPEHWEAIEQFQQCIYSLENLKESAGDAAEDINKNRTDYRVDTRPDFASVAHWVARFIDPQEHNVKPDFWKDETVCDLFRLICVLGEIYPPQDVKYWLKRTVVFSNPTA